MKTITEKQIASYRQSLIEGERAAATVEKYVRDVARFSDWLGEGVLDKIAVLNYKAQLLEGSAVSSVNSCLSSLNGFFAYIGRYELRVKTVKVQKRIFLAEESELTRKEYERLIAVASSGREKRVSMIMQTICSTGIRVSELKFVTVEAVSIGRAEINCKGKRRSAFLPDELCTILKEYVKERSIKSGPVFITKSGAPLDRSNIWSDMKRVCRKAGISEKKVFPHNLRHLFARTYYEKEKDVVRLADILGHSSINTTRIYTMETGEIHRKQIQNLGLVKVIKKAKIPGAQHESSAREAAPNSGDFI